MEKSKLAFPGFIMRMSSAVRINGYSETALNRINLSMSAQIRSGKPSVYVIYLYKNC